MNIYFSFRIWKYSFNFTSLSVRVIKLNSLNS